MPACIGSHMVEGGWSLGRSPFRPGLASRSLSCIFSQGRHPQWFNVGARKEGIRTSPDGHRICRGTVSNRSPTFCPHRPGLFSQVGMLARLWLRSPRSPARIQPFWVLGEKRFVFFSSPPPGFPYPSLPLSHASLLATHAHRPPNGGFFPGRFQLASLAWGWLAKGLSRNSVIGVGE